MRRLRWAKTTLLLLVCVSLLPLSAATQSFRYSPRVRRHLWLRWVHKQVKQDCERVAVLAHELHAALTGDLPEPVPRPLLERVEALEVRAWELRADVARANEYLLSVSAVTGAREIRSEARDLRRAFVATLPGLPGKKLSQIAREMEKRADDVYDNIRQP